MTATMHEPVFEDLTSPAVQRRINALRATDNVTNWVYLAREYLCLGLAIGLAIAFIHYREAWGLSWLWNIPVSLLAIFLVGAGQHRLSTLGHEASHYMLFRNRLLNELVSDWFCMFPMFSTTHHYRLQHLPHHQYVNDPERDPDIRQMSASGHRFRFPMARLLFVWSCVLKQLIWFPNLIRYIRVRARYATSGEGSGPYGTVPNSSRRLRLLGMAYMAVLIGTLYVLARLGNPWLLGLVPLVLLAMMLAFYALIPGRHYPKTFLKPDLSPRVMTLLRITHMTLVFTGLAWLSFLTDEAWGIYYVVLWVLPLFTTFGFFMILRQVVQHGNASQERLTNTRIFHVNRLIQAAVFPLGMDYHLPHHLFPMIPHYRLRELHALLLETASYRQAATVVEGYFLPRVRGGERQAEGGGPRNPTVLDLMARPQS